MCAAEVCLEMGADAGGVTYPAAEDILVERKYSGGIFSRGTIAAGSSGESARAVRVNRWEPPPNAANYVQ